MTAREYYDYLLRENGYSTRQPLSDAQRAIWFERFKRRRPDLGDEEVSRLVQDCAEVAGPDRIFDELTEDIVNHIPDEFGKHPPHGLVREFPINDINGVSFITPSKEYLILINRGLTVSFHQWAKLVINVFLNQLGFEGTDPEDQFEKVMTIMRYSLNTYMRSKEIPSFPVYDDEPGATLSTTLGMSATHFVLAHEFAHILLGHLGQKISKENTRTTSQSWKSWLRLLWHPLSERQSFDNLPEPAVLSGTKHIDIHYARRNWAQELNADRVALTLLFKDIDYRPQCSLTEYEDTSRAARKNRLFDIETTLAGIGFLFGLHSMIDRLHIPEIVQTHPPTWVRWEGIKTFLDSKLDMNQYGYANTLGNIMNKMILTC